MFQAHSPDSDSLVTAWISNGFSMNSTEFLTSSESALNATGTACKMQSMSSQISRVLTRQTCASSTTISSATILVAQTGYETYLLSRHQRPGLVRAWVPRMLCLDFRTQPSLPLLVSVAGRFGFSWAALFQQVQLCNLTYQEITSERIGAHISCGERPPGGVQWNMACCSSWILSCASQLPHIVLFFILSLTMVATRGSPTIPSRYLVAKGVKAV